MPLKVAQSWLKDAADDAGETGWSYGITNAQNSAVVMGMRHFKALDSQDPRGFPAWEKVSNRQRAAS